MNFSLTTLGTASALPTVSRYPSAHVLNIRGRLFLIDCGEGCQMQMCRYGISMMKIDDIFISHIHGDHVFGLFGLLSSMSMKGRTAPLIIHAPEDFAPVLESFLKLFGGEMIKYEIRHDVLNSKEPVLIYHSRNIEAYAFPLNHRVLTYGFLFREKIPHPNIRKDMILKYDLTLQEIGRLKGGLDVTRADGSLLKAAEFTYQPFIPRSFAYCSDTAPFPELVKWIRGVDILYHEATFAEAMSAMAEATFHSTAAQAAEVAKEAGVGKMVIGHFSSRYKDPNDILREALPIFEDTYLAREGETFSIPLSKGR